MEIVKLNLDFEYLRASGTRYVVRTLVVLVHK